MLLTLCFLPLSLQIQKTHMDFVCPQNEWFQRDCKPPPGGICPSNRPMGMYRWMGLHFHSSIDYDGVAFFIRVARIGSYIFGIWGIREFRYVGI